MRRTKAELEALHKTAGIMWGRAHALGQTTFGGILRSRVDKCFEVGSLVALDCVGRGFDRKRYGQVGILTKVTLRRGDKTCPEPKRFLHLKGLDGQVRRFVNVQVYPLLPRAAVGSLEALWREAEGKIPY